MRDYARVSPRFWLGSTGKKLRKGGPDVLSVAFYLMTAPTANMIGLYYLPISTMAHETGLTLEGASKALRRVVETGFAFYDDIDEVVWIPEMGAHQIGLSLHPEDKQVKGVIRITEQYRKSIFFRAFMDRYQMGYHLPDMEAVGRGLVAPWEGVRSQEQEKEQEQDTKTLSFTFVNDGTGQHQPNRQEEERTTSTRPKNGHSRKKGDKKQKDTTPLAFAIPVALEALTSRCPRIVPPRDFDGRHVDLVAKLIRAFPNLKTWELVGDWLAAGGVAYMSFIGLDCLKKNLGTWVPVSEQWAKEGRKPLTKRAANNPSRGLAIDDA